MPTSSPAPEARHLVRRLTWVLDRYLRLLHPVMPHITEEIWGRLPHLPTIRSCSSSRRGRAADAGSRPTSTQAEGVAAADRPDHGAMRAARAESGIAAGRLAPAPSGWPTARRATLAGARSGRRRAWRASSRRWWPTGRAGRGRERRAVRRHAHSARLVSRDQRRTASASARGSHKELAAIESQLAAAEARLSDRTSFMTRRRQNVVEQRTSRAPELRDQADVTDARE